MQVNGWDWLSILVYVKISAVYQPYGLEPLLAHKLSPTKLQARTIAIVFDILHGKVVLWDLRSERSHRVWVSSPSPVIDLCLFFSFPILLFTRRSGPKGCYHGNFQGITVQLLTFVIVSGGIRAPSSTIVHSDGHLLRNQKSSHYDESQGKRKMQYHNLTGKCPRVHI